ncbi:hypothetical protein GCM10007916_04200 [Psychromonas marina]|uniref:HD-GYP domain-containing protein n=1 Tax=Psychromonas marina TaxID=88364 RepID=A0ABQ6DWX2_9GAMM|nr:HD domain-containing phosphohydrolase [Psychromonas marina]GLS89353.1 hypothetical protein GCM10007916_04200 [Psychromonas marina]
MDRLVKKSTSSQVTANAAYCNMVIVDHESLLLLKACEEMQALTITLLEEMALNCKETGDHVIRVGVFAALLAKLDGQNHCFCEHIRLAAQLHDVGKVTVSEHILKKQGQLNADEREQMKLHARKGYELLSGRDNSIITMASHLALDHHERWDGSGYPNSKKGKEISFEGRITAIADVFDALASKRYYKAAWSLAAIKEKIAADIGKQFDPHLGQLFIDNIEQFYALYHEHC